MFWKFEPFVSYFGIKLLKSFIPGLLSHHLLSIRAFQSWAWFHWEWRYDVILIKIRRHDRSHLRVDTWEEDRRKVESSMFVCFKFQSINLSSFVCEPVFFSCSWSSRLNLVVIVQCLVREHFSTNWSFIFLKSWWTNNTGESRGVNLIRLQKKVFTFRASVPWEKTSQGMEEGWSKNKKTRATFSFS